MLHNSVKKKKEICADYSIKAEIKEVIRFLHAENKCFSDIETLIREDFYMKNIEDSDVNLIFDRTFFSEQVYGLLGYKEYDFTDIYEDLLKKLGKLNYEIYYISLYLEDTNIFNARLNRVHHGYQSFSIESSIKQQNTYKSLLPEIKKLPNTKVYEIAMDDFDKSYEQIREILEIN